ncbi:MAG: hypothetical protein M3387_07940, partial [Actinomycetota bacterium]|nr:hypothetical protein [Actinomycetota bacterium]
MIALVGAYVRRQGFGTNVDGSPDNLIEEDLAAVIISAAARSQANPEHLARREIGSFSEVPGRFDGWTLPELAVLHRHR